MDAAVLRGYDCSFASAGFYTWNVRLIQCTVYLNASTISWLCSCAFDGVKQKKNTCNVENICTGKFLTVDNNFFYPPDLTVKQFS